MIKAISNLNLNNSNLKLTPQNSILIYKQENSPVPSIKDTFINDSKNRNISFTGYRGANGYGTQEERDALSYRVRLTPAIIKRNMQNASSAEEGASKNYKLLINELEHHSEATKAAIGISNDYAYTSLARYSGIKEMAPTGSKIWFVGVLPQWGSVLTGSFKRKVERDCTELTDDINDIIHTHIFGNLEAIINGYNEAHDAFIESLSSLNNDDLKAKYVKSLNSVTDTLNRNTAFVCATFNQKRADAMANKSAAIEAQHKSQAIRTGIKTVMNALGCGLVGIAGVDEIIVNAGIPIVSNVMGADLVGNAISVVSKEAIESVAWVTMEGLDSGNIAKENLAQAKSSGVIGLTKKSLINILKRVK